MQQQLYSLSGVAELLQVKPYRILYMLSVGAVPEPRMRVAGKRLWTIEETVPVSERLQLQAAAEWERKRRIHGE